MTSSTTNDLSATHTTFLDVPGEVRNSIYRVALTSEPIVRRQSWQKIAASSLNLLLTNHQIYHEAASILYDERRFLVELSPWMLRTSNLVWQASENTPASRQVSRSVKNIILEFNFPIPCSCQPHLMSREDYRDLRECIEEFTFDMLPGLKDLTSIEVKWETYTPCGDHCYMPTYPNHTRTCSRLLRPLRRYFKANLDTMGYVMIIVPDPQKDAEPWRSLHEQLRAEAAVGAGDQAESAMGDSHPPALPYVLF